MEVSGWKITRRKYQRLKEDSGQTDLTEFLMKAGQNDQISPGTLGDEEPD